MTQEFDLSTATDQDIHNAVDYLTYCCYKHNRQRTPDITPFQWSKIFGPDTYLMEIKYQRERNE